MGRAMISPSDIQIPFPDETLKEHNNAANKIQWQNRIRCIIFSFYLPPGGCPRMLQGVRSQVAVSQKAAG
jgi:hypothetical protein